MNENKLLIRLKQKKRGALDKAIHHYSGYAAAIVYRTAGGALSKEDMEEVISDVFIALWRHAGQLDENSESIRGYLAAIARNTTRSKMRGFRYDLNTEDVPEILIEQGTGPEDTLMQAEIEKQLLSAIELLGQPDREIFFRYFFQDEKLRQISEALNMKLSTVKTRFGRGKIKLKKLLVEMGVNYNE